MRYGNHRKLNYQKKKNKKQTKRKLYSTNKNGCSIKIQCMNSCEFTSLVIIKRASNILVIHFTFTVHL